MSKFPLNGILIDGKASYKWLSDNAGTVNNQVSICSAFLRSSILEDFSNRLAVNTSVRVLARWQLGDLLAGASDLESYEVCKKFGWDFHISTNFHGKVFSFPPHGILVGSANATGSGLGLLSNSNSEVCTVVQGSAENIALIDNLFASSRKMTDELYEKLKTIYQQSPKMLARDDWPELIYKEIAPIKFDDSIFLSECLATNGDEILLLRKCDSSDAKADASLLSLATGQFDHAEIAKKLQKTKLFMLLDELLDAKGGEVYFGTLTAAIHDSIMDDPAPYRRDVKVLVQNLYSWISHLSKFLMIGVDKPRHSERLFRL